MARIGARSFRRGGFLLVIIACFAFLYACREGGKKPTVPPTQLKIIVKNSTKANHLLVKELSVTKSVLIDSIPLKRDSAILLTLPSVDAAFYLVLPDTKHPITLLIEPGEQVNLNIQISDPRFYYTVGGSPGSSVLQEYSQHTDLNYIKEEALKKRFAEALLKDDYARQRAELDQSYRTILADQKNFITSLIKKHPRSLANIFLVNQTFGPNKIFDERKDFRLLHLIDSLCSISYPENKHAIAHHRRMSALQAKIEEERTAEERVKTGNSAPVIRIGDDTGNAVTLGERKNKVTLLYFWSALSGKCRQDHKDLRYFFQANERKGLEMVGVSLDQSRGIWQAAIQIDQPGGKQILQLEGLASEVAQLYNIDLDLPVYFVLGRDGKIMGKGRRFKDVKAETLALLNP